MSRRAQRRFDHIGDMDVGLALVAVAKDAEAFGLRCKAAEKIEPNTVSLAGANHVAKTEDTGTKTKHGAITGDEGFGGKLAGAVGRNGNERGIILRNRRFGGIPIDAAAGGVEEAAKSRAAHRLDDVVGEQSPLVEVDFRTFGGKSDVGVGGEMDDPVMTLHGGG